LRRANDFRQDGRAGGAHQYGRVKITEVPTSEFWRITLATGLTDQVREIEELVKLLD
jgi:hypothetical protein